MNKAPPIMATNALRTEVLESELVKKLETEAAALVAVLDSLVVALAVELPDPLVVSISFLSLFEPEVEAAAAVVVVISSPKI